MKPAVLALLLALLAAGCVEDAAPGLSDAGGPVEGESPLAFTAPTRVGGDAYGFEPSIAVAPDGSIYVTAHKSRTPAEGTQLASWFWYSTDQGATWQPVRTPADLREKVESLEADVAVDANGRVYLLDSALAEAVLTRWSPSPDGPTWDFTRALGTVTFDDRPWLDTQGDEVVYYLGNGVVDVPSPGTLAEGDVTGARIWLYTSEDGGLTWSPGRGFPDKWWCDVAASKADDVTVHVVCQTPGLLGSPFDDENTPPQIVAYRSGDRGRTWASVLVTEMAEEPGRIFPSTATDRGGHIYHGWIGEGGNETHPRTVQLARSLDGGATWDVLDLSPFAGSFERVWVSGGTAGTVAVSFYATADPRPTDASEWFPYVLVIADAATPEPSWHLARLSEEPVVVGPVSPPDFFQNAIGPDNAVHVAYGKYVGGTPNDQITGDGYRHEIQHVRQIDGPNLPSD